MTMKKYYLIYAAFGVGFLICCSMVFLNSDALSDPDARRIKPMFNGFFVDKITGPSTAGNIAILVFIAIIVIAVIARIVYVIYKYIKKLKAQDETDDIDNISDLPETTDKNSLRNIFGFLLSARRGYIDSDSLRDEKRRRKYDE